MITIREVAKAANVSISTVSRVINNNPNVAREKRNRVLAAIEEVGYVPNVRAKEPEIAAEPGKMIIVITTIFHSVLCAAIEEAASEMGYEVLFKYTGEYDSAIQKKMSNKMWKDFLNEDMIGGIILLNPSMNKDMYEDGFLSKFPVVQVGCSLRNFGGYTVATDDFQAAYDMTEYLIQSGYKRIVMVSANDTVDASHYSYTQERYFGYHKALKNYGLSETEKVIYCDLSSKGGREAALKLMDREQRPDGVFCMSDKIAFGVIKAFLDAGIRVPEDVGVAGFDGTPESNEMTPSVTTVAQSFDDIGAEAVQMLDQIIRGEISNGRKLFVAHRLEKRQSTK